LGDSPKDCINITPSIPLNEESSASTSTTTTTTTTYAAAAVTATLGSCIVTPNSPSEYIYIYKYFNICNSFILLHQH